MTKQPMSAGDPIESRCTKCRKITNHIIVAMQEEAPVKVQCNTCGGQHKYRPPAAPKKKAAVRKKADPKAAEQKEWVELQPEMDASKAVAYSMDTAFKVGVLMKHPQFGLGLVQRLAGPRKVEVLFEDGRKIMRCQ